MPADIFIPLIVGFVAGCIAGFWLCAHISKIATGIISATGGTVNPPPNVVVVQPPAPAPAPVHVDPQPPHAVVTAPQH